MRPVLPPLVVALLSLPLAGWPQGGAPLGPEFRVNTFTTGSQTAPAVTSEGSGDFIVVWQSLQDGSGYGIFGQRYTGSGAPLGSEFRVNTYTTGNQIAPAASSDILGNFVVVWQSEGQDGSGLGVFGQRYAASGAPLGPEFRVNSFTTGDQRGPSLAFDKISNFFVAWTSDGQDGSAAGVFAQHYAAGGIPVGPEFRVNSTTAGGQMRPSVAANIGGNFVVVWESEGQDYGTSFGVFGQRYISSGVPQGPEFRVNTYTPQDQLGAAVAVTLSNFVVVWQSYYQDTSSYGVFGQRYNISGTPIGPEFRVNSFVTGYQFYPSVAADAGGDFVVAWESADQDGSGAGVYGQRFASSGAGLGPEFRVNTYTTNSQRHAAVASTISGNFVVVWQSDMQDGGLQEGSGYGVFGQRYSQIVPVELMHFRVE